jgi:predicted transcriptional regulator
MIAQEIISDIITPVKTSDTGETIINHMAVYRVRHLPIVNNRQFLGLISEEEIYNHNVHEPAGSYRLTMIRPYCKLDEHIFEVMQKMALYGLTLIPVLDEDDNYMGSVVLEDLLKYYAESFSFSEPGSILVIDTIRRDYALSEIARIAESENSSILAAFITRSPSSEGIKVTLKLNTLELSRVAAAFERYDYQVSGKFTENEYEDALKSRYDALMKYLDI